MEAGQQSSQFSMPQPEPGRNALPPHHPPVWVQRLLLVIEVGIAVWAGMLVMVLPWTRLWSENPLLGAWPAVKHIVAHSFVRGLVSGVGLVDIWMGISDAVHYRDLK